jgi:hypothetical protein
LILRREEIRQRERENGRLESERKGQPDRVLESGAKDKNRWHRVDKQEKEIKLKTLNFKLL